MCGAALCLAASWATWSGQAPTSDAAAPPPPLPRPHSEADEAASQRLADGVLGELQATAARTGILPQLGELEGLAPDGRPYLPSGLPDNPLAPGVAGVVDGCAGAQPPTGGADWRYCTAPLTFAPAHIAGVTQSGNP